MAKHGKEPAHVAVVGIVSLVAVVGLVLLFVSLAPFTNVGKASEALRTKTTTYEDTTLVKSGGDIVSKDGTTSKATDAEKSDARGTIAAMVKSRVPAPAAVAIQNFNDNTGESSGTQLFISGVNLKYDGNPVTAGMVSTHFVTSPPPSFPSPTPILTQEVPQGGCGDVEAKIHFQKYWGNRGWLVKDDWLDRLGDLDGDNEYGGNDDGPAPKKGTSRGLCENYFTAQEQENVCSWKQTQSAFVGGARVSKQILDGLCKVHGADCVADTESLGINPGKMQCGWTTDTEQKITNTNNEEEINRDDSGFDEMTDDATLGALREKPLVMAGLKLECPDLDLDDPNQLRLCLGLVNKLRTEQEEHDLKAACESTLAIKCTKLT